MTIPVAASLLDLTAVSATSVEPVRVVLSREHRLTDAAGFSTAVRGRRAAGRGLVVHHAAAPGDASDVGPARVGLIVGKAVGGSVVRNRVKRRLRHLLRDRTSGLAAGALVAVRALPASASMTSADLAVDLDRCLARVGPRP